MNDKKNYLLQTLLKAGTTVRNGLPERTSASDFFFSDMLIGMIKKIDLSKYCNYSVHVNRAHKITPLMQHTHQMFQQKKTVKKSIKKIIF